MPFGERPNRRSRSTFAAIYLKLFGAARPIDVPQHFDWLNEGCEYLDLELDTAVDSRESAVNSQTTFGRFVSVKFHAAEEPGNSDVPPNREN